MKYDYDLFVIGAGSGGVRAARMAAGFGAKTAIAEEHKVGGTCVIRGCVPKKLYVYASHFSHDFKDAEGFGWSVPKAEFSWKKLVSAKDKEIERLNAIYIKNLEKAKVELLHHRAVFKSPHEVQCGGKIVSAETILIATGARPFLPEIEGVEYALTSNEIFDLPALPKRIVIVGGGYIAVEFACIFAGLGAGVDLLYRGEEILRGFDDDLRKLIHLEMEKQGISVRVKADIRKITAAREVHVEGGEVIAADAVLYATGRIPNTEKMGLSGVGVQMGERGEVVVDEYSRSNIDNIYAVGDVTNRVALTPIAIVEGSAFANTLYGGKKTPISHETIPSAVFTQPGLGTIGLTEVQARERGEVKIFSSTFRPMKHTLSGRDEKCFMKLVVDAKSDIVLGLHIMGADAGEMIQAFGVAVTMGATKADFDKTLAVHPTAGEELVTMG